MLPLSSNANLGRVAAERPVSEYRLSPAAERDLDVIFDYTVRQWGIDQAVSYIEALDAACSTLAHEPEQAPGQAPGQCYETRPDPDASRIVRVQMLQCET